MTMTSWYSRLKYGRLIEKALGDEPFEYEDERQKIRNIDRIMAPLMETAQESDLDLDPTDKYVFYGQLVDWGWHSGLLTDREHSRVRQFLAEFELA